VFETPLGPVPSWVMGRIDNKEECIHPFHHTGFEHPRNFENRRTLEECKVLIEANHAGGFLTTPMARYTVRGGSQREAASTPASMITDQMQSLRDYAKGGSVVAQHMLKTRELWMLGERALEKNDYHNAVRFFALSARASRSDGDPFSGWWMLDGRGFERYHKALDFISQSSSTSTAQILDDKLVRALMYMQQSKWAAMEEILTECITQCAAQGSGDAYDFYHMRIDCRGNGSDWRGLIEDAECCIQMQPEDPMPYFWKGVALAVLDSDTIDAAEQRRNTVSRKDAFCRFIEIAPPEGRKVCQAWWNLALCEMKELVLKTDNMEQNMDELNKIIVRIIDKGFEAEEKMLPILREHEAKYKDTDTKSLCIMMREAIKHKGENWRSNSLIHNSLKTARESGNEAFRSKLYQQAVDQYSKLIEINNEHDGKSFSSEMHLVFSNRSAAFEKLQDFEAAERDALEAIKLKPEWVKGYARLARARIGCFNAAGALQALEQARANLAPRDFDGIRDLESEVQSLLAQGVPKRCDPVLLKCWPSVHFKDSVFVVDAEGSGDFVSLCQALVVRENPTTIIVLAGTYTLRGRGMNVKMKRFQIIGDGNVNIAGDIKSEFPVLFSASNAGTHMYLENLKIRFVVDVGQSHESIRHCVEVCSGACATVTRCEMRSSGASCVSRGQGSSLVLLGCKTFGPGAGPLVANYGFMEAHDCHFSRSKLMGVEVREFGSCLLKHCIMSENSGQGICVYNNGIEAELQDCTIQKCGRINRKGAVMVSSGKVALHRCSIVNNRGDGIVVQDENGAAHLELNNCKVHGNGGLGLAMYGGSGHIVDNRFQENASLSVSISTNLGNGLPFREIQFTRNFFDSGVARKPILVLFPPSMEEEVLKIVTFDNNNSQRAGLAKFCIDCRQHTT
jgi:tetratricopeptide (TPR) repeat protein